MIFRSEYPDIAIPDVSLPEFLFDRLPPEVAEQPAVIDGATGHQYTYRELEQTVDRGAAALARRGLGRGDVAALVAPNCADYPAVFHGVLRAGAALSPVNPLYTARELADQFRDSRTRIVFTTPAALSRVSAASRQDGVSIGEIVVLGDPGAEHATAFADFLAGDPTPPSVTVSGTDLAALPYSSGTTGLPKGVMLTHRNLVANVLQLHPLHRQHPGSRILAVLPLFHIYGLTALMNAALHHHATLVTLPRFDLDTFLRTIAEHRIDHAYIAPPIAIALAKSPLVDEYDLSSLEIVMSGAASLDAELATLLGKRLNTTVVQGYGLTESSPCTHGIPPDRPEIHRGSIGVVMPNVQARVVNPATGEDAPAGASGELWVRGPNIMRGYLNDPHATAAALDDEGFLHTGDLVTVDPDGAFHVVGRLKELIKYKGYQVSPAELEAVLLTHEGIADAAVIGVHTSDGNEIPKAFVVRRDTHPDLDAAEVLEFVAALVAPYKKIRALEFIDAIPKSPAGKILRKVLRTREQPTPEISVNRTGAVATISIDRPAKRNALTLAMYAALADAIAEADADADVQVIVLTGSGGSFSAGNDLHDFQSTPDNILLDAVLRFQETVLACTTVLIAAVDGPAVGIGATLLLHCDLVYSTHSSYLQFPFVKIGLVPEFASSLLLPRVLGPQRAAELLLTGRPLPAPDAAQLGLVNEVLPDRDSLHKRVADQTAALLSSPPAALRATRALLRDTDNLTTRERLAVESTAFAELLHDPDTVARISAMTKRA
ncbi:AMP-binding protein [Streptomyces sp. NPDC051677]|uniref:AMP-binding protein n=1 Tax=Streptomyces sp. NPDC051677 TaxID=3365669 RepID=UPI0037D56E3C